METEIFKLIINSGGLAIALAILFFYSFNSFRQLSKERSEMREELGSLQTEFHTFKNNMIKQLFEMQEKTNDTLTKFCNFLEKKM
jgi:peroxiredoxin family protein